MSKRDDMWYGEIAIFWSFSLTAPPQQTLHRSGRERETEREGVPFCPDDVVKARSAAREATMVVSRQSHTSKLAVASTQVVHTHM